jgi:hypothetical protein
MLIFLIIEMRKYKGYMMLAPSFVKIFQLGWMLLSEVGLKNKHDDTVA